VTPRDPLWLPLAAGLLAALGTFLLGFVLIRGASLLLLDALREVLP
jgi:hypothetical protein